jgi:hypothetical protein
MRMMKLNQDRIFDIYKYIDSMISYQCIKYISDPDILIRIAEDQSYYNLKCRCQAMDKIRRCSFLGNKCTEYLKINKNK